MFRENQKHIAVSTTMETLYEEGYNKTNISNKKKKLSVPIPSESTRTPLGRRRSATATLKNGREIILEVPEDVDEENSAMPFEFHEGYDSGDVDDIQLGGEAIVGDTCVGGLEIPHWCTPRGSLGGGPSAHSSFGSRCGSTTSQGSTSSAISYAALQSLRRTAAAAQATALSAPNVCDPTSIASLSRVGSGCFTNELYSAFLADSNVCNNDVHPDFDNMDMYTVQHSKSTGSLNTPSSICGPSIKIGSGSTDAEGEI